MDQLIDQAIVHLADESFNDFMEAHPQLARNKTFKELLVKRIKKVKQDAKLKDYIYMITFTISPKLHPEITDPLVKEIEHYIREQGSRTGLHVKEMHLVKELHKNKRPHWHVGIVTTKSIKKSLFTYYQKKYGSLDFKSNKGKNIQDILGYMSKSDTPTRIV